LLVLPPTTPAGESRYVELTDVQLDDLARSVRLARADGAATVRVPGVVDSIPVDSVEDAVDCFVRAKRDAQKGTLDGVITGRTVPKVRKGLLIKPNIETVDYLQNRDVLTALPLDTPLPAALKTEVQLKKHQLDGFNWLRHLFGHSPERCGGAVLADDMGLGKTLQLLTLIAWA